MVVGRTRGCCTFLLHPALHPVGRESIGNDRLDYDPRGVAKVRMVKHYATGALIVGDIAFEKRPALASKRLKKS